MSAGPHRLAEGGLIDRHRPLAFAWQGRMLHGFEGDTLASALLGAGEQLVARSFKLHRPRGVMAAGLEEANALVEVGPKGAHRPNLRATEVRLHAGLQARSQHAWPGLRWDLGSVLGAVARFLPAGFYYKTFRWPSWHAWEPWIRRAAGLGRMPDRDTAAPARERHVETDVLVIGSGPAGLAAAVAAATAGQRVWLVERDHDFGGALLWRPASIEGLDPLTWRDVQLHRLRGSGAALLTDTLASALFGDKRALLWRSQGEGGELIHLRCRRIVLATGATERPLVFAHNDRPGIFLASAACEYARRYGVAVGRRVAVLTHDDDGWHAAAMLEAAGVNVVALLDTRAAGRGPVCALKVASTSGVRIVATRGATALRRVRWRDAAGREQHTDCDALAVHGGWNAAAMLAAHAGMPLRWDEGLRTLAAARHHAGLTVVGGARGLFDCAAAVLDGRTDLDSDAAVHPQPSGAGAMHVAVDDAPAHRQWVDHQNDVTLADIALAHREGMVAIEHLKRYTTLGMAPDQGRTSHAAAIELIAGLSGQPASAIGSTRPRPPVFPIPLAALAAHRRGELYRPIKQLPIEDIHAALGAVFEDYGGWARPAYYPRLGEDEAAAVRREASRARSGVVLMDASPLGKIEVRGPDATEFLERIYATGVASLPPGRTRYGLMLNERGVVIDDGVLACVAPGHYIVGTTSGAATRILQHLEEWHQTEWPGLRLVIHDATAQWGVVTVSGPASRTVLQRLPLGIDLSPAAFPHLGYREGSFDGAPLRIQRVSFTGECSFEIAVPRRRVAALWHALWQHGQDCGIAPLGIEALMVLRIEKGYLHVGSDTDATTTPDDVGFGTPARRKPMIAIGRRGLETPEMLRTDRPQLVGLRAEDGSVLPVGSHVLPPGAAHAPARSDGHVTSSAFSPALGRGVALAMLRGGRGRLGEAVTVWKEGAPCRATIAPLCAIDPAGERLRDVV